MNKTDNAKLLGLLTKDMIDMVKTEWTFREILSLVQDSDETFDDWRGCWDDLIAEGEILKTEHGTFRLRDGEEIWNQTLVDPGIKAMEEAILMIHNICTEFLPPITNAVGDLPGRVKSLLDEYDRVLNGLKNTPPENWAEQGAEE